MSVNTSTKTKESTTESTGDSTEESTEEILFNSGSSKEIFNKLYPTNLNINSLMKITKEDIIHFIHYSWFLELILCIIKFFIFARIIMNFGFLIGSIIIIAFMYLRNIIFYYGFKMEKLTTNDLLLLGFENKGRNNMMCTFFFENNFNAEKMKEHLINKAILTNDKLRKRIIRRLSNYYWYETTAKEASNRVRILSNKFYSKEDVIEYLRSEVDNHIDVRKDFPYDFQICEIIDKNNINKAGAIIYKSDHVMADGLGMVNLTMTIADDLDEDMIPNILKSSQKIPLWYKIIMPIAEIIFFPYYSFILFRSGSNIPREPNPLFKEKPKVAKGLSTFKLTDNFDFGKIKLLSKKLKIGINDLILAVLSSAVNKYTERSNQKALGDYTRLVCAIPIGIKTLSYTVQDVELNNSILGAVTKLPRISNPLNEYNKITVETNKTIKNHANIHAWKYVSLIMNHFLPYFLHKFLALTMSGTVDLAVSALPGPNKEIKYLGSAVTEILPIMSLGVGKVFLIVGSYNQNLRITVNVDKIVDINLNLFVDCINEELRNVVN